MSAPLPDSFACEYVGPAARDPHAVRMSIVGQMVYIAGGGVTRLVPRELVRWAGLPARGPFIAYLDDGAALRCDDQAAWAAFARTHRLGAASARPPESWRALAGVAGIGVVVIVLAVAAYRWGVPLAAGAALGFVPVGLDETVGDAAFASMDGAALAPSRLPETQRQRVRQAFSGAVAALDGDSSARPLDVVFRTADMGPNAFALPGGRIVVTDELVTLVNGREDVIVGVLGHEYGHVKRRHAMRLLVQRTFLSTLLGIVLGDVSPLLAGAPAILGELAYSREFEREADAEAVRVLRQSGHSPAAMVYFFERLAEAGAANPRSLGIALASHPADEERVAYFRAAAD